MIVFTYTRRANESGGTADSAFQRGTRRQCTAATADADVIVSYTPTAVTVSGPFDIGEFLLPAPRPWARFKKAPDKSEKLAKIYFVPPFRRCRPRPRESRGIFLTDRV